LKEEKKGSGALKFLPKQNQGETTGGATEGAKLSTTPLGGVVRPMHTSGGIRGHKKTGQGGHLRAHPQPAAVSKQHQKELAKSK